MQWGGCGCNGEDVRMQRHAAVQRDCKDGYSVCNSFIQSSNIYTKQSNTSTSNSRHLVRSVTSNIKCILSRISYLTVVNMKNCNQLAPYADMQASIWSDSHSSSFEKRWPSSLDSERILKNILNCVQSPPLGMLIWFAARYHWGIYENLASIEIVV